MKKTILRIITVTAMLSIMVAAVTFPASAAVTANSDIFLKIEGIEGEAKDSKHHKWIEATEFKHASIQSVQTGSPDAAGSSIFEPIVFKHPVDKATPKLQEACMKGTYISGAQVEFCCAIAGKQEVVYKAKFEGIKIVKAEVVIEELEDGKCQSYEIVSFLANKQTWTKTTIGLDNTVSGNTEANYDQSKKASMFDSNANIALTVACVVILALVVAIVILVAGKKKKAVAVKTETPENDTQDP